MYIGLWDFWSCEACKVQEQTRSLCTKNYAQTINY